MTNETVSAFTTWLVSEERSSATVEKYTRFVLRFLIWLGERELTKDAVIAWKSTLTGAVASVNGAISAVNSYLAFLGHPEWKVKQLKMQRKTYRDEEKELTKEELHRLVRAAEEGKNVRLARAIETIAATGIRVSELRFFTVEAVQAREATITNKGKTRTVLIPKDLALKLKRYAKSIGIRSGEIFVTRSGKSLSRTQLWAEMKALCRAAGVEPTKVFPHNLRHLFAVVFYRLHKDIAKLADLLGHSSINTTRIYLIETGKEHLRQLEAMRLVL